MSPILIHTKYLFSGIIITTLGAIPLGLVNISVANTAAKNGIKAARNIALGSTIIELLYSFIAIATSLGLVSINNNNPIWQYSIFTILIGISVYFFFKKTSKTYKASTSKHNGILHGITLNLLSLQVLAYWLFISIFCSSISIFPTKISEIIVFVTGVALSKLLVLETYAHLGLRLIKQKSYLEKNINKFISIIILISALIQITKI